MHLYDLPDAGRTRRARFPRRNIAGPGRHEATARRVLLVEDEAPLLAGTAEVLSAARVLKPGGILGPAAPHSPRSRRPPVGLTSSSPMKSCPGLNGTGARECGAPPPARSAHRAGEAANSGPLLTQAGAGPPAVSELLTKPLQVARGDRDPCSLRVLHRSA